MKPMHRYFIHFTYTPGNGKGAGSTNAMWNLDREITSIDDINFLQRELHDSMLRKGESIKEGTLVITNYTYVGRVV